MTSHSSHNHRGHGGRGPDAHRHGSAVRAATGEGRADQRRRLGWTLGLAAVYMLAEAAGGWLTGSLALLADAGHMLSDVASLALALFALRVAERPPTERHTYGFHRVEILAALVNGATLIAISALIVVEAVERLHQPPAIDAPLMMAIAAGGLVVNGIGLAVLHGGRHASLNLRGAWLHVVMDALGSVQALAAGALILLFGWRWADPLASLAIAALVVISAVSLLKDTVAVLMERAPSHIDVEEVRQSLLAETGVAGVHDLHVWTITSGFVALSAHVVAPAPAAGLLERLQTLLRKRFGIEHTTLQLESETLDGCEGCGD